MCILDPRTYSTSRATVHCLVVKQYRPIKLSKINKEVNTEALGCESVKKNTKKQNVLKTENTTNMIRKQTKQTIQKAAEKVV